MRLPYLETIPGWRGALLVGRLVVLDVLLHRFNEGVERLRRTRRQRHDRRLDRLAVSRG
jgi:hypothetical protein